MSAYVVGKAHIDAILTTALQPRFSYGSRDVPSYYFDGKGRTDITEANASEVGQLLLDENVASVAYRYPDAEQDGWQSLPGPIDTSYRCPYVYTLGRLLTPVEMFKALDGFDYQACEHPGWEGSEAHAIVNALRAHTWSNLPGYDEAETWEVSSSGGPDAEKRPTAP